MSVEFSADQCLALVEQSPEAVAVHDKKAWLAIFARYNIVEDPVGSRPHISGVYDRRSGQRGCAPLERFYEAYIAANTIIFHVDKDIVCGLTVIRDLTLEIRMPGELTVRVPMHLVYELIEQDGVLKVQRLAAHWELASMLKQQLTSGWSGLVAGSMAGWRMLKYLRVGGTLGFMAAVSNVGKFGRLQIDGFLQAFNGADNDRMSFLFATYQQVGVNLSEGKVLTLDELMAKGAFLEAGKTLAAGNMMSVSCRLKCDEAKYHGVAFFEFNRHQKKIIQLALYLSL